MEAWPTDHAARRYDRVFSSALTTEIGLPAWPGRSRGDPLQLGSAGLPELRITAGQRPVRGFDSYGAVQLLTQDVGVSGVTSGVGQPVDHDVEQLDVLVPPGHEARTVDLQYVDRGVDVSPHPAVQADDGLTRVSSSVAQ